MKIRPENDDLLYPGMPERKSPIELRVWDEFLDPERHADIHYINSDKIEDILRIFRAILNDEMNRHGSEYVAANIWRDGNRLNYAFEQANFDSNGRPGDVIGRQHFIVFGSERDAAFFEIILHSVIRFGLTKFTLHNGWNTVDGMRPLPRVVNHLGVVA